MPSDVSRKILIVAAEASSCLYARRLLEYWRARGEKVEAFGIGDAAMAELGFECLARAEDLAVVGLQEVLAHWPVIKTAFYALVEAAAARRPNVILLLDYPDFNLRLAKKIHALKIPVVYYISPQVWAWRRGRVKTIKKYIAKMLVVFPFEVEFYRNYGVEVEFVGHPLLDEIAGPKADPATRDFRRAKFGLKPEDQLLALMPGSRRSELKYNLAAQLGAARALIARFPHLRVALLVAPNFAVDTVREQLGSLDFPLALIQDEPFAMIGLADVVLCASGTATLMVGLLEKPMVIMYRMNAVTAWLAKLFVRHTAHFGLINLVLGKRVVSERFQEQASPALLASEIATMLENPGERRRLATELKVAKDRLGSAGATARVGAALEKYWTVRA